MRRRCECEKRPGRRKRLFIFWCESVIWIVVLKCKVEFRHLYYLQTSFTNLTHWTRDREAARRWQVLLLFNALWISVWDWFGLLMFSSQPNTIIQAKQHHNTQLTILQGKGFLGPKRIACDVWGCYIKWTRESGAKEYCLSCLLSQQLIWSVSPSGVVPRLFLYWIRHNPSISGQPSEGLWGRRIYILG